MKNFCCTLFAACFFVVATFAVPAYRGVITVSQPDGTEISVCQHGDEYFHYTTTEDGYLLQRNASGVFEYAELNAANDIVATGRKALSLANRTTADEAFLQQLSKPLMTKELALEQNKMARAKRVTEQVKAEGTPYPRILVLLVNFSDKAMVAAHDSTLYSNMLNQKGFSTNGATGSVADYFTTQSNNTYTPQFDVYGPFTLPRLMSYYGSNDSQKNDNHPDQMVVDACALAYADGCNFANYDYDKDDYVDNIYVIYAGYSEAAGAAANTIWPHSWAVYSSNVTGTLKYNGKTLNSYACNSELTGTSGTSMDGIGTFCHEFSHVIGLPDYYDTEYGTNEDKTLGMWNLMDYGCYNNDGNTPPNYSAYDRYFMGWLAPTIMNEAENVSLSSLESSNTARVVTSAGTLPAVTSTSWAYYFENRQQTGWDTYLPGHGLLVTKVKYNATAWSNNEVNNGSTMYVDIVEADGKVSSDGDAGDTYPGTSNVTSYTPVSGYPLTEIAEASGAVTFKFMGGVADCEGLSVYFSGDHCTRTVGETCITSGTTYTATIIPNTNYLLTQADFLITIGGTDLTAGTDFTYSGTTLTVPNVTGALEIVAVATKDPSAVANCDNYSYSFTAKAADGSNTLGDYTWNCTLSATSQYFGYEQNRGAQFGSGNYPAKQVSLTTSNTENCCVSKVTVAAAMASSGDGKLAVYVAGTQAGETKSLTTTSTDYEFTLNPSVQGTLEIRMTNTVKAMYIKTIAIEYDCGTGTNDAQENNSAVTVMAATNGLRLQNLPQGAEIRVFNTLGQTQSILESVSETCNISLSKGIYLIRVMAEGKATALKAIVR